MLIEDRSKKLLINCSLSIVTDTPMSPTGPSSPSQEGLFTDLRLLSLEKQLNIETKVCTHIYITSRYIILYSAISTRNYTNSRIKIPIYNALVLIRSIISARP